MILFSALVAVAIVTSDPSSSINLNEVLNVRPVNSFISGDSLYDRDVKLSLEKAAQTRDTTRNVVSRESVRSTGTGYEIIGTYSGSCIPYAWSQGMQTSGYHIAKNYPTSQTPQRFAITYEGPLGHAVVIEKDLGNYLQVRDANYRPGKITRRIIPKSIIKGYLS